MLKKGAQGVYAVCLISDVLLLKAIDETHEVGNAALPGRTREHLPYRPGESLVGVGGDQLNAASAFSCTASIAAAPSRESDVVVTHDSRGLPRPSGAADWPAILSFGTRPCSQRRRFR